MILRRSLQWLHSWLKQEARNLTPCQSRWLKRGSVVMAVGLCSLALLRQHTLERERRDSQLQQGVELAAVQWSTLRATAYDWAHWDETHAFARGEAPGYPDRNLKAASGLSNVAPVVIIIDRGGGLLTVHGRRGASSWGQDPLVRCSLALSRELLAAPKTLGMHCRDHEDSGLWIGVIEPITDTGEQEAVSGLFVLLAPLRHPNHGPAINSLMQALERQLQAHDPGPEGIRMKGQLLWGPTRQVLSLNPEPVVDQTLAAMKDQLNLAVPVLLSLLTLRAILMLQVRRTMLHERQQQRRSHHRLRQARRQLGYRFINLPHHQREQALRLLSSGRGDPIDDLARELEMYALELDLKEGKIAFSEGVQFEPIRDGEGQVKRAHLSTVPTSGLGIYQQAIEAWGKLPTGVRRNLGLQLDLCKDAWCNAETVSKITSALQMYDMHPEFCTIGIETRNSNNVELEHCIPLWRNAGFTLSLLYTAGWVDSARWLNRTWFDEVQIMAPALNHPSLGATQQELIRALIQLAKARGLTVAIKGINKDEQLAWISEESVSLISGSMIGNPVNDISELLL